MIAKLRDPIATLTSSLHQPDIDNVPTKIAAPLKDGLARFESIFKDATAVIHGDIEKLPNVSLKDLSADISGLKKADALLISMSRAVQAI